MYEYRATLHRVVDGDTVDLIVDLGFYMAASIRFRVLGVDTPELRGGTAETKTAAHEAKDFVTEELGAAATIIIRTEKADSFGRWLADVRYVVDGEERNLTAELLENGLGVPR